MEKKLIAKETYNLTKEYLQNTLDNFNDTIEKTKFITSMRKFITQTEYEDKVNNFNSFSKNLKFTELELKTLVGNYIAGKVIEDMMNNVNVEQYDCFVKLAKDSCDEAKEYCINKKLKEVTEKINISFNALNEK